MVMPVGFRLLTLELMSGNIGTVCQQGDFMELRFHDLLIFIKSGISGMPVCMCYSYTFKYFADFSFNDCLRNADLSIW